MHELAARPTTPSGAVDLRGDPGRRRREWIIAGMFRAAAIVSIVISGAIVFSLFGKALDFVLNVDIGALWAGEGWFPRRGFFDLRTIVAGTFVLTGVALLVAAPLGLGAAIYLAEFAKPRVRRTLKPILEILAGIPSVVLGFFALTWISPEIVQRFFSHATAFNMAAAGLAVGVLITPLVAAVTEDSLRAVPHSLREAAYALAARKRSVVATVILPAATSGIMASFILAISRAIGETMIVAIAAGATGGSDLTLDPTQPGQTMTAAMTALAIGSDQVKGQANTFPSLFFVGLLLFFMTLILNVVSERFVRRVREKY
jgi:phosphate transport system permease protein